MSILWGSGVYGSGGFGGGGGIAPSSAGTITGNAVELAIDYLTGDIEVPPRWLRGPDAIIQRLRCRLQFFAREWFLDQRLGIPYFDQILVKHPRLSVISSIFRKAISTTPGVASVGSVRVMLVQPVSLRQGTIDFQAVLDDGLILTAKDEPFIIREAA